MKKLFFSYANFFDLETNQKKTIISDLTDSIEKSAYLLSKKMQHIDINNNEFDLNYGYHSFTKKELKSIKNDNLYVPIIRYKLFKEDDFFDYDVFYGFKLDKNQNIQELRKKYIDLMKKNKDHIEYMEDMYPDKKYVYLIKYSYDDFSGLNDFLKDKNNYYHFLIELESNARESLKESLLEYDMDLDEEFSEGDEEAQENLDDGTKKVLIEMYRNRFLNNHKKWNPITIIIDQLLKRTDLYLTISSKNFDVGTFAEDNKHFIYSYLDNLLKKDNKNEIVIFIRQFTSMNIPNTNIPYKRVSAVSLFNDNYGFFDKEYLEYISRLNRFTGELMDKEEGVTYLDSEDMFRVLNIKLG